MFNYKRKIENSDFIFGITELDEIIVAAQTASAVNELSSVFTHALTNESFRLVNQVESGVRPRMESKVFNFIYKHLLYNDLKLLGYSVKKVWTLRSQEIDEVYMAHLIKSPQKNFEVYV